MFFLHSSCGKKIHFALALHRNKILIPSKSFSLTNSDPRTEDDNVGEGFTWESRPFLTWRQTLWTTWPRDDVSARPTQQSVVSLPAAIVIIVICCCRLCLVMSRDDVNSQAMVLLSAHLLAVHPPSPPPAAVQTEIIRSMFHCRPVKTSQLLSSSCAFCLFFFPPSKEILLFYPCEKSCQGLLERRVFVY